MAIQPRISWMMVRSSPSGRSKYRKNLLTWRNASKGYPLAVVSEEFAVPNGKTPDRNCRNRQPATVTPLVSRYASMGYLDFLILKTEGHSQLIYPHIG
jgi:hypothetical protein